MNIKPLRTPKIIKPHDDLMEAIKQTLEENKISEIKERSVLIVAETVVATTQGRIIDITKSRNIRVSSTAQKLGNRFEINPILVHYIIQEADHIFGGLPGLLLTEKQGILIANSGIDKSNSGSDTEYSLWPEDPFKEAEKIKNYIKTQFNLSNFGVIISDSRVHPMRRGVVGIAIGVAGFEPIVNCKGKKDLFGYPLKHTERALADQLADAAHVMMGEADEQTPFVLCEDVPVNFTNEAIDTKSMLMPKEKDLFLQILKDYEKNKIL